jgi:hypothetical protein
MTDLHPTAAYIRKDVGDPRPDDGGRGGASAFKRELWELLRTPHTVESLGRAVTTASRSTTDNVDASIRAALEQWIEADLVELSPDS